MINLPKLPAFWLYSPLQSPEYLILQLNLIAKREVSGGGIGETSVILVRARIARVHKGEY